ncbi:MAG: PQQ-binding-like beta-propeller repeat protein [Thermoleophilia bacterium]|nr:PQQ-binding-like beta-propeller repeat protein [Thermoleophilia bacterium]
MKGIPALFALVLGAAVLAVVALKASASSHDITPIPAFSAAQLTSEPGNDWLTARGDIYNRQYSSLNSITKSNVAQLKIAWHTRVAIPTKGKPNFTGLSAEAEPVVYNGTMYMPDAKGNVFAFDAVTGERLWFYKPKFPKGFSAALPTSRGVVIGDGKVFMAQTDGSIVGLDQSTGRVAWRTKIGNFKLGYFFTSPPTYVNGTLVIGTSGGDFGARCKVVALDAKTGKVNWTFFVIPIGKEIGANSWPKKRAFLGGGAVWAPLAVDPALNLVYVGVGNPIPYNGNVRGKGQEFFTESVLALHLDTGKYAWHFQEVHHDIWDYDAAANPLILFDLNMKGTLRHAVASIGKTGWVYILDRATGKPILGINERKVPQSAAQHTWPTQPVPVGDTFASQCPNRKQWAKWKPPDGKKLTMGCIFTPYTTSHYTVFAPTALGGADWPPSSYSSKTGFLYICSKDSAGAWKALPKKQAGKLKPLGNFFQIEGLFQPPGSPGKLGVGKVVAMNMRDNRRVWSAAFSPGDICYSGILSTGGGLVFVGRNDRRFQAYDDTTGKLLWSSPKLLASIAAPPMSYTANGKQYVAVYAGGNGIASGFGTSKVKYGSDIYVFALPS